MAQLPTFEEVLAKQLEDPEFRARWERTAPARAVAIRVIGYRADHGLSQTQLGKILGKPQSAVARLELGEHTPSIDTLIQLSETLGIEFLVDIKPATQETNWVSPEAETAKVFRTTTTAKGGRLLVAAS